MSKITPYKGKKNCTKTVQSQLITASFVLQNIRGLNQVKRNYYGFPPLQQNLGGKEFIELLVLFVITNRFDYKGHMEMHCTQTYCPPGLEFMAVLDHLLVHQKTDPLEGTSLHFSKPYFILKLIYFFIMKSRN
jgi:hypothetical protein